MVAYSLTFVNRKRRKTISSKIDTAVKISLFVPFSVFFFPSSVLLLKFTCPFSLFLLIIAIFSLHRKTENPITQILLTLLINTYYNRYRRKLKQVFSFSSVFLFMSKCLDWIHVRRFHGRDQSEDNADQCRKQHCDHNRNSADCYRNR